MANTLLVPPYDPAWRYWCGRWARKPQGPNVVQPYAAASLVGSTNPASDRRASIRTNAVSASLHVYQQGQSLSYRLNGATTNVATLPNTNTATDLVLFAGASGWTDIDIICDQTSQLSGLYLDPAGVAVPSTTDHTKRKKLVVFGHSYVETAGQATFPGVNGPAALIGDSFAGWQGIMEGIGGTDVAVANPVGAGNDAASRVQADVLAHQPDAILIWFGRNNGGTDATYQTAYGAMLATIRAGTAAPIFCVGQFQASGGDSTWTGRNAAINAAASGVAGCHVIDPTSWITSANWFGGTGPVYIGSDNVHPTNAGNAYLAGLLTTAMTPYMP